MALALLVLFRCCGILRFVRLLLDSRASPLCVSRVLRASGHAGLRV